MRVEVADHPARRRGSRRGARAAPDRSGDRDGRARRRSPPLESRERRRSAGVVEIDRLPHNRRRSLLERRIAERVEDRPRFRCPRESRSIRSRRASGLRPVQSRRLLPWATRVSSLPLRERPRGACDDLRRHEAVVIDAPPGRRDLQNSALRRDGAARVPDEVAEPVRDDRLLHPACAEQPVCMSADDDVYTGGNELARSVRWTAVGRPTSSTPQWRKTTTVSAVRPSRPHRVEQAMARRLPTQGRAFADAAVQAAMRLSSSTWVARGRRSAGRGSSRNGR